MGCQPGELCIHLCSAEDSSPGLGSKSFPPSPDSQRSFPCWSAGEWQCFHWAGKRSSFIISFTHNKRTSPRLSLPSLTASLTLACWGPTPSTTVPYFLPRRAVVLQKLQSLWLHSDCQKQKFVHCWRFSKCILLNFSGKDMFTNRIILLILDVVQEPWWSCSIIPFRISATFKNLPPRRKSVVLITLTDSQITVITVTYYPVCSRNCRSRISLFRPAVLFPKM